MPAAIVLFFLSLIPLMVGFAASAIANRLAFAGWGLLVAAAACGVFVFGVRRGWSGWLSAGRVLLVFSLGCAWLARLVAVHAEALDLGLAATSALLRRPALVDSRAYLYAAIVLSVLGVLSILVSHGIRSGIKSGIKSGTNSGTNSSRGWRERPRPLDPGKD